MYNSKNNSKLSRLLLSRKCLPYLTTAGISIIFIIRRRSSEEILSVLRTYPRKKLYLPQKAEASAQRTDRDRQVQIFKKMAENERFYSKKRPFFMQNMLKKRYYCIR